LAAIMMGEACSAQPAPATATTATSVMQLPSLAATYKDDFLIGLALDFNPDFNSVSRDEQEIIKRHFNSLTPENSMKPQSVHPAENRWTFETADRLVEFCQANKMTIIGHTLVWHAQTPGWFFEGANGQPVTREIAIERLRQHIRTEVGRYEGKIHGWDVVNEAISDRPKPDSENLRDSPWFNAIGPDFINYAFKFAHEADPQAELYYNDYSIEKGAKHKSSLILLKRLINEGVPITAVGIQGHWGLSNLPYAELDKAIEDYKALGLRVNITELDITITGQGGGQLTPAGAPATAPMQSAGATTRPTTRPSRGFGRFRGPTVPPTPEQLHAQAAAYARFFEIFQKHADVIDRITLWGLNDARSWRAGQAPLIFDRANKPKPALQSILDAKK
jgi:GH35 family endo-1,4-beta-xylanase